MQSRIDAWMMRQENRPIHVANVDEAIKMAHAMGVPGYLSEVYNPTPLDTIAEDDEGSEDEEINMDFRGQNWIGSGTFQPCGAPIEVDTEAVSAQLADDLADQMAAAALCDMDDIPDFDISSPAKEENPAPPPEVDPQGTDPEDDKCDESDSTNHSDAPIRIRFHTVLDQTLPDQDGPRCFGFGPRPSSSSLYDEESSRQDSRKKRRMQRFGTTDVPAPTPSSTEEEADSVVSEVRKAWKDEMRDPKNLRPQKHMRVLPPGAPVGCEERAVLLKTRAI